MTNLRFPKLSAWLSAAAMATAVAACGDDDAPPRPDAMVVPPTPDAADVDPPDAAPPPPDADTTPDAEPPPTPTHGGSLALFELTVQGVGLKLGQASVGFDRPPPNQYLAPDVFVSTSAINPAAGCTAYHFKFDAGDLPTTSTGDAGDVTFTGATGGDITCTREARSAPFDTLSEYVCAGFPAPGGDFLVGADDIDLGIAGGVDFGAAGANDVSVPANPIVLQSNLSGFDLAALDDLNITYSCPGAVNDDCTGVIVVSFQTTDTQIGDPTAVTDMPTPTNEFAVVTCSFVALEGNQKDVTIPSAITQILNDVAPVTANYRAIVFHGTLSGGADSIGSTANFLVGEGEVGFCRLGGGCLPPT